MARLLRLFRMVLGIALIILSLCAAPAHANTVSYGSGLASIAQSHMYLPLVSTAPAPFTGRVTINGQPAADVYLRVLYYRGGGPAFDILAETYTDSGGKYVFPTTPYLSAGDTFSVYYAYERPNALAYFACSPVTQTTVQYTCDFDIADIPTTAPANESHVGQPYTFRWQARPDPSETYTWELYYWNPRIGLTQVFTSGPLGHAGQYVLNQKPENVSYGTPYRWVVTFSTPEGKGSSEQFPVVIFDAP